MPAPSMPKPRSAGSRQMARSLWYTAPGKCEVKTEQIGLPPPGEARVRTLYTGISRGTERLVSLGQIGASEWQRMRAPLQAGDFPFPVKYGYCAVGTVEIGADSLRGKTVFCLHPHQDVFHAPAAMLCPVPDNVPPRRATLAANVETALNALWDGGAGPGDRIAIVGAGIVGLLTGWLAARIAGADVVLVDIDPAKAELAQALGVAFALPDVAAKMGEFDLAVHTSATQAGLNTAIGLLGLEGTVVELSWYGEKPVTLALGGAFHVKRLNIVSSQVGQVSAGRRPRWTYRRRLEKVMELLADPRLDVLVADEIAFADAARLLPGILGQNTGLAPVIRY